MSRADAGCDFSAIADYLAEIDEATLSVLAAVADEPGYVLSGLAVIARASVNIRSMITKAANAETVTP